MVMHDYANRDTAPSWRKKATSWLRRHREPLLLFSMVLLASLAGSV